MLQLNHANRPGKIKGVRLPHREKTSDVGPIKRYTRDDERGTQRSAGIKYGLPGIIYDRYFNASLTRNVKCDRILSCLRNIKYVTDFRLHGISSSTLATASIY